MIKKERKRLLQITKSETSVKKPLYRLEFSQQLLKVLNSQQNTTIGVWGQHYDYGQGLPSITFKTFSLFNFDINTYYRHDALANSNKALGLKVHIIIIITNITCHTIVRNMRTVIS